MNTFTIGKVAKQAGLGVETIRFYERTGLLEEPERSDSGYRQYPPGAIIKLRFIKKAKRLGFLINDTVMLWVTAGALLVSVCFLAYRAKRRRGYKPFWTGVAASIFILAGKFIFDLPLLFYGGVTLLIAASLWNSWPRKVLRKTTLESKPQMEKKNLF
jgi:hypothetical protein